MALSTNQDGLLKIYLAAFLRAPEKSGFDYWSTFFDQGRSLDDVSTSIFALSIVKEVYPESLTNSQFVSAIYQNVFGKAADSSGLSYWAGQMDTGLTRGQLVSIMINTGLALPDTTPGKLYIANRYRAAGYALDLQQSNGVDVSPSLLKDAMSRVTADATTMATYNNDVAAWVKTAANGKGITYSSTTFTEATANDGSISNTITLLLVGDTFKGNLGAKLGTIANVPAGLTASLVKTSDTTADFTLTGKATSHVGTASIGNLAVTLADADFVSGSAKALAGVARSDLKVVFYDLQMTESSGTLVLVGNVPGAVVVDLDANRITLGGVATKLASGDLTAAISMDASGVTVASSATSGTKTTTTTTSSASTTATASLSFKGDGAANTYVASSLGDTIQGRGGNDQLTAGSGVDKFVFEASAAVNGLDVINGFQIGKGGDVLNFSAFLNKTGTSRVATSHLSSETAAAAWSNGDVLVVQGYGLDATALASLFASKVFAAPTQAAKAVVISCDIVGDATVWYLTNQTMPYSVESGELQAVATLVGVNNLVLSGFDVSNFA